MDTKKKLNDVLLTNNITGTLNERINNIFDRALKDQIKEYEDKYKEALSKVEIIGMSGNELGLRIVKIQELEEQHKKEIKKIFDDIKWIIDDNGMIEKNGFNRYIKNYTLTKVRIL